MKINGKLVNIIRFSDDITLISDSAEGLKASIKLMSELRKNKCGIKITKSKIKVIKCTWEGVEHGLNRLGGKKLINVFRQHHFL